jgi:hypothetical protein
MRRRWPWVESIPTGIRTRIIRAKDALAVHTLIPMEDTP